ncbi:Pentatricopeptide repeat-containing protein At5g50990 [Linum perenne]
MPFEPDVVTWRALLSACRMHKTPEIGELAIANISRLKSGDYVLLSNRELVMMDVSEEEKEENLRHHSEKLALAYGILKTGPGTEIRISKNLRICDDCHSWFKFVSMTLNRVILVRDRIRFHRFEGGSCSCGEYW